MQKIKVLALSLIFSVSILNFCGCVGGEVKYNGFEAYMSSNEHDNITTFHENIHTESIKKITESETETEPAADEYTLHAEEKKEEKNETKEHTDEPSVPAEMIIETVITAVGYENIANIENAEFENMKNILESYGNNLTVFYQDCISGETYYYNREAIYVIASILKAPYAVYLYKLAADGNLDLNDKIGNKTIEQLLSDSIRLSDNAAYNALTNTFGYTGFKNSFENSGISLKHELTTGINGMVNAECLAVYLRVIYSFINENSAYSEKLKEHLMNTELQLIKANAPVARKYGALKNYLSEIGIIYNEKRPYLLAVMLNGDYDETDHTYATIMADGQIEDYLDTFMKISLAVEKYNNSKIDISLNYN